MKNTLDYADQRYYFSQFGRFMTPDTEAPDLRNPPSFGLRLIF